MPPAPPEGARPGRPPRVVTIPPGAPFLDNLVRALLDGVLVPGVTLRADPLRLADTTIYLPTRRAARALERAFVDGLGGAALLPRIAPLGDVDHDPFEDEGDLAPFALPPTIGELDRRLALAGLIRAWAANLDHATLREPGEPLLIPGSPAAAAALAAEFARLIDAFETEGVLWDRLDGLVPEEHDRIWSIIRDFLAIAATAWPAYLEERGLIGPALRRSLGLAALAERYERAPPSAPVIVAGSTGTIPATGDLMAVIARLPMGAIVLPGLDVDWLDGAGWEAAARDAARAWTHPQHALSRLLKRLGVAREEVETLAAPPAALAARGRLVADALRPAETTEFWAARPEPTDWSSALAGVTLVEAVNEHEEAVAIAVLLREALERDTGTAALVTPDRKLARRVAAELARWGVVAEDSAGRPLADMPAGVFARLLAEAAVRDLAPADLVPLLKHPLACFGRRPAEAARAAAALERAALRGPSPGPGATGLRQALAANRGEDRGRPGSAGRRGLFPEHWDLAEDLIRRLEQTIEPLCALGRGQATSLAAIARAHRDALRAAAATSAGAEQELAGEDGEALLAFFDEVGASDSSRFPVRLADYPALLATMLRWKVLRPRTPSHPQIQILGALEARLLDYDRVVLGGLVEGVWPPVAHNDPWLSRPMRSDLGLPPPEWRIGLSAHDFSQALGCREVVLSRALKLDGAPTVPARWLQRMEAVAGEAWRPVRVRGEEVRRWAAALDQPPTYKAIGEPKPKPPRALRPDRLSVTEIETLIRDPYSIYAKRVLKLVPLDGIAVPPGAADRGSIIHDALARFVEDGVDPAAPDALDRLLALGHEGFAPIADLPGVKALWLPRFRRIAEWFIPWERERRATAVTSQVERTGALTWLTEAGRSFTLRGRVDRIDSGTGGIEILDYKTGKPPTCKQVEAGLSPQLPLEAAMLAAGAFEGVPAGTPDRLTYVRLSGGFPPGEDCPALKKATAAAIAEEALREVKRLVDAFEDEDRPYRALIHPMFARRPNGDYDHLARVAEWSLAAAEAEEDGG